MAQKNVEKRFLSSAVEVRSEEGKPAVVEGYAAVFDQETVIGGAFAERVAPGAFDGADMSNTVALFNHNIDQPLARVGRGLELTVDERGLKYRFELGNQSYAKDLAENIRMGNVSTSSFGFTVREDDWERRDDGVNLRIIKGVDLLFDVSPTTQGAYPTTEVGLRSMELAFANEEVMNIEQEEVREEEVVAEEAAAAPEQKEDCGCDGKNAIPAVQRSEEEVESEEVRAEMDGYADEEEEEEEEEAQPMADAEEEEEEEERTVETVVDEVVLHDPDLIPNAYGLRPQTVEPEARSQNSKSEDMSEKAKSAPAYVQGLGDTEMHVSKRYSFGKAIKEAAQGRLTGLEAEMNQEARKEFTDSKVNVSGGFSVPSMVLRREYRDAPLGTTDVTGQGLVDVTGFGGTIGIQDAGLVQAFAPADIGTQLGARTLNNLTGDVVFQVQGNKVAGGKPGQGQAATNEIPDFAPVKLTPTRYSAYTKVTEQMLAQSADDMGAFIAMDIRRAVEATFNTDIVTAIDSAADSNHDGTIPAFSGTSFLKLEQKLLENDVDLGNVRGLFSAQAYREGRETSMDAGSGLLVSTSPANRTQVLGYPVVISSSVATAGNGYFCDATQMVMGNWGGVNILVDPYTDANSGIVRIIANVYKDFKTLQSAGFVGASAIGA
jgi:HK97 family phage prohead protease